MMICELPLVTNLLQCVSIALHTNVSMQRGDYAGPLIMIEIKSFEVFDEERNKIYTPKILDFINETLNIEDQR